MKVDLPDPLRPRRPILHPIRSEWWRGRGAGARRSSKKHHVCAKVPCYPEGLQYITMEDAGAPALICLSARRGRR
jgi:hypothetical protein